MKKFTAVLLVLCLAAAGVPAALAAVEHVHGADRDHSKHAGCAIHHYQIHGAFLDAASPSPEAAAASWSGPLLAPARIDRLSQTFSSARVPRAPPYAVSL